MINLEEITTEYLQRVKDLARGLSEGERLAILTTYFESYNIHKEMFGSYKHLLNTDYQEYALKMADRIQFMYCRAEKLHYHFTQPKELK